ncbi:MAG: alanine racemase [Actinomycetota bacterium]|jgi:alanine racemase
MREIRVDLNAIVANYRRLKAIAAPSQVMAIVKADAYGHGSKQVAKALQDAGVDALGVADLDEALELREQGITVPVLAWIMQADEKISRAIEKNIELGVSNFEVLELALQHGGQIHVKVDTGLGRGGFPKSQWPALFEKLRGQQIAGLFSHLANTSKEEDLKQQNLFEEALELAKTFDLTIGSRHLAASAGTLSYPDMHYDMVRCGIAIYGLNPDDRDMAEVGLKTAMRVSAQIVNSKQVQAGQGVSYNYRYRTQAETNLALVPFGYAEGMPRISMGHKVLIEGSLFRIAGQIAMDQFVVDTEDHAFSAGTEVVIFGDPKLGEPSAEDLGASAQTINYDVVTRIGGRASRKWTGGNL